MEKVIYPENARGLILYHPAPANAGHCWEWHAAPEWEVQCMETSLLAHATFWAEIHPQSSAFRFFLGSLKRIDQ